MATIQPEVEAFENAVYGEEVRSAMVSLCEKVNDEVEKNTADVAQYTNEIMEDIADISTNMAKLDANQEECLTYSANAIDSAKKAKASEGNASAFAVTAQSYAVGGTNTREDENTQNCEFFYNSAQSSKDSCNEILTECRELVETAKAEVVQQSFWVDLSNGSLMCDNSSTAINFGINNNGYLYMEV